MMSLHWFYLIHVPEGRFSITRKLEHSLKHEANGDYNFGSLHLLCCDSYAASVSLYCLFVGSPSVLNASYSSFWHK